MSFSHHEKPETIINIDKIIINLGEEDRHKPHGTHLVLITNNSNGKFITMALTLKTNEKAQGTLSLTDDVTSNVVTASFSGTSVSVDNTAAFTAVVNADGSITATAVAPGSGILTVSTTASYTDSNNQPKTEPKIVNVGVSVAQPTADATTLVLTFGPATAQ